MITITGIVGTASDPRLADRLHHLEHDDRVETLVVGEEDTSRRRLRGKTDKGTDVAIALERSGQLVDGAVLLLEDSRAIVLRKAQQRWLRLVPRDADAALEAGYCAGNHHWKVRFEPGALLIATQGPAEHYVDRLEHLVTTGRITWSDGMSDVADALAVLQFGDSFFPSGAVSFSWGLEGLSDSGVVTGADAVRVFVVGQLRARWAEFDRPVVVAAHQARMSLEDVTAIDAQVEMQSPCAELRSASRRMGEAMLSVFARLGIGEAATYRESGEAGRCARASRRDARLSVGARGLERTGCRRPVGA